MHGATGSLRPVGLLVLLGLVGLSVTSCVSDQHQNAGIHLPGGDRQPAIRRVCPRDYTEERTLQLTKQQPSKLMQAHIELTYPWWLADLEEVAVLRGGAGGNSGSASSSSSSGSNSESSSSSDSSGGSGGSSGGSNGSGHHSSAEQRQHDITLVTLASLDRLKVLQLQCRAWPGTIAAALYLPLANGSVLHGQQQEHVLQLLGGRADLPSVLEHLRQLHSRLQGGVGLGEPTSSGDRSSSSDSSQQQQHDHRCTLDLAVYAEELPEASDWWSYPVNALRNRALALARTELVLLLDGDFVPSVALADELLLGAPAAAGAASSSAGGGAPAAYSLLRSTLASGRAVMVLPALEANPEAGGGGLQAQHLSLQDAAWHGTKASVVADLRAGRLRHFQPDFHAETDLARWAGASRPYEVHYASADGKQPGTYEPYMFALREQLPAYDERYRGYHYNKMSFCYRLFRLGVRFLVHPTGFALHHAHPGALQEQAPTRFKRKKLHLYFTLAPYDAEYVPMVADRSVCGTAEAQPYPPEVEEQAAGHEAADSKASQGGITVGTGASQGQGAADVQQGR